MSRKKKKENPIGLLIIWILGLLLIVFTVLASLIIWLGWIACEAQCSKQPRGPNEEEILLDEGEQLELKEASKRINEIETRLEQIGIDGQHLRRRKDGLFHAGSSLGARLNEEVGALLQERSDVQAIRHELLGLPRERLRDWSVSLSRLLGFRWAVSTYVVCICYAMSSRPPSVAYMDQMVLDWLQGYLPTLSVPLYGGIALASIVASCVGGLAYFYYNRLSYSYYERQLPFI